MAQFSNHITIFGSKQLQSAGFEGQTLEIKFKNGALYQYSPCQKHIWDSLTYSPNPDSYFNQNIRGKIDFKKVQ